MANPNCVGQEKCRSLSTISHPSFFRFTIPTNSEFYNARRSTEFSCIGLGSKRMVPDIAGPFDAKSREFVLHLSEEFTGILEVFGQQFVENRIGI